MATKNEEYMERLLPVLLEEAIFAKSLGDPARSDSMSRECNILAGLAKAMEYADGTPDGEVVMQAIYHFGRKYGIEP